MIRSLAAIVALLIATTLAPAAAGGSSEGAAATSIDHMTGCVTRERGSKYVTRITRTSGVERLVDLRIKDRAFVGNYVWRVMGGTGGLIVGCRMVGDVVRLKTRGGSRVWVVPPTPVTMPAPDTAPPAVYGSWPGPVSFYSTAPADWHVAEAIAAWNAGLSADRQLALQSEPCAVASCVTITETSDLANGPAANGEAHPLLDAEGQMSGCSIRLAPHTPAAYRLEVAAHEIGHCLGLTHWDYAGSIMGTGTFYPWSDLPTQYDFDWLASAAG